MFGAISNVRNGLVVPIDIINRYWSLPYYAKILYN